MPRIKFKSGNVKSIFIYISKFVISISVFIYAIYKINIKETILTLLDVNSNIFILIFLTAVFLVALNALIQHNFLKNINLNLNYYKLFKENLIASFYGFIAPGLIGMDSYYTYSYGKKLSNYTKAFSGILFLRILGFSIAVLFVILSFIYVGSNLASKYELVEYLDFGKIIIAVSGVIAVLVLMFLLFKKSIIKYYKKIKNDFFDLLKITFKRKRVLLTVILLLISFYAFSVGSRLLLSSIIGINMPVIKLGAVILIVNFILLIPVSISGIGVREGGFIGLLSLYGIPAEKAFLLSMFDFGITIIAAFFGGVILLYRIIFSKKNVNKKN